MSFDKIQIRSSGQKNTANAGNFPNVPGSPSVPFIEGGGIGMDTTPP